MSLKYRAADKTVETYHASKALLKYIRGPRASSKTVAAIMDLWAMACTIRPTRDKVRKSRFLLTRAAYPTIERTILKSVVSWLGSYGHVKMSQPPIATFTLPLRDGTRVESEWMFMAVPDQAAFQDFRSLELTGAFVNECIEQPFGLLPELMGSMNRYPGKQDFDEEDLVDAEGNAMAPYESKILIDTNPGDEEDPWRTDFEDKPPEGALMLVQQGAFLELDDEAFARYRALNPGADFIKKFGFHYVPNPMATYARIVPGGYRYWADIINTATKRGTVLTLVCNQWAPVSTGRAIWPDYNDAVHVAPNDIEPLMHLPLRIGMDHSGLHPAAVIGQVVMGQLRVLDEVIFTDDKAGMTFTAFIEEELVPVLQDRYPGMAIHLALDPAIMRNQIDGRTVYDVLNAAGITGAPAPTNDPTMRRDAVARRLNRKGGFVMSPRCRRLRAAMRGGYRFKTNAQGLPIPEPVKDKHSHPAEALQYLCVGLMPASSSGSGVGRSERAGQLVAR